MRKGHVLLLGALAATTACTEDYVHVVVENFDQALDLDTVQVSVFGGDRLTSFNYTADFDGGGDGKPSTTDFVITFPEVIDPVVDIRVVVPFTARPSAGDARLDVPADGSTLHIELTPADRAIDFLRHDADEIPGVQLLARLGPGVALAWPSPAGVSLGLARNPESPLPFPEVVSPDTTASRVHIASRPTPGTDDEPDLAALTWQTGDDTDISWLVTHEDRGETGAPVSLGVGEAKAAVAPAGAGFDVVTATWLDEDASLVVRTHSADGAVLGEIPLAMEVTELIGIAAGADGDVSVALATADGPALVRLEGNAEPVARALAGELRAFTMSDDGDRLLAAAIEQVDGENVLRLHHLDAATLDEGEVVTVEATPQLAAGVAVSPCMLAWTESREDGSGDFDLRYQELDDAGVPFGESHVLNGSLSGDYLFPALACVSEERAFAAFYAESDSTVRLRCLTRAGGERCQ